MASKLVPIENEILNFLYIESTELAKITAKSVLTAKSKSGKITSRA